MRNIESNILRYKRNEIKAYIWSKGIAGVLISDIAVVFGNEACLSRRRTHLSLSNYKRKQQQLCCLRVLHCVTTASIAAVYVCCFEY